MQSKVARGHTAMPMKRTRALAEKNSQFTLFVADLFHFQDGLTVFVGTLLAGDKVIVPAKVKIYLDQEMVAEVTLQGQYMPGDQLPKNSAIVYTKEPVDLEHDVIKNRECKLLYEGQTDE